MQYTVKYSWANDQWDSITIPWAFSEAAAKLLAMYQAAKKHPTNKGILVTEAIAEKTGVDDILKHFK